MNSAKPKVLLVDDDADLLLAMKAAFRKMNCTVLLAANGIEALEILDKEKLSLVISDVRMPKMNGVELLEAIQRRGIDVPVMIISGFTDYTAKEIDRRDGIVLLDKGQSVSQLRSIVAEYLSYLPTGS